MDIFGHLELLVLIIIRMSSFFIISPIFGGKNVPAYTKIILAFFISMIVYMAIPLNTDLQINNYMDYFYVVSKEVFTGWILGFIVYLVFNICFLAGQLIDIQIGFSMVNVFDPLAQVQVPITGNFYYMIFLLLMMSFNVHHNLIRALIYSFEVIPLGKATLSNMLFDNVIVFFTNFFVLAFKIAAPVVFTLFVLNMALGILVKTAPQMNMFVVGIPLKIIVGLLILLAVNPIILKVCDYLVNQLYDTIFITIKGLIV